LQALSPTLIAQIKQAKKQKQK